MEKSTNWKAAFTWGLISVATGMAIYAIYRDGFSRYTWLSDACLAAVLWVLLPTGVPLEEKFKTQRPQFWVAVAAMTGMLIDVFVLRK